MVVLDGDFALGCGSGMDFPINTYISMFARTNRCYNKWGYRTKYIHFSIPHYILLIGITKFLFVLFIFLDRYGWDTVYITLCHWAKSGWESHESHHSECLIVLKGVIEILSVCFKFFFQIGRKKSVLDMFTKIWVIVHIVKLSAVSHTYSITDFSECTFPLYCLIYVTY
jgi:hypothetical protein